MNSRITSAFPSRYPTRTPASENALENVRRMTRFLWLARYGRTVPRENSKYASSTITSASVASSRRRMKRSSAKSPVGLFGLVTMT